MREHALVAECTYVEQLFRDLVVDNEVAMEEPVGVKKGVLVRLGVGNNKGMGGRVYVLDAFDSLVPSRDALGDTAVPDIASIVIAPGTDGISNPKDDAWEGFRRRRGMSPVSSSLLRWSSYRVPE